MGGGVTSPGLYPGEKPSPAGVPTRIYPMRSLMTLPSPGRNVLSGPSIYTEIGVVCHVTPGHGPDASLSSPNMNLGWALHKPSGSVHDRCVGSNYHQAGIIWYPYFPNALQIITPGLSPSRRIGEVCSVAEACCSAYRREGPSFLAPTCGQAQAPVTGSPEYHEMRRSIRGWCLT